MDTITAQRRSENMRRIRAADTRPEIAIRRLVHALGYRYRLHSRTLPGKPDLVFPGLRRVIFVHGCFWHQHPGCKEGHTPKSRLDYWIPKLQGNKARDSQNQKLLKKLGWKSLVVWECEISRAERLAGRVQRFLGPPKERALAASA